MEEQEATPSKCGKPLKPLIPSRPGNGTVAKRNKLGYGNNAKDDTMGNPQPSPKAPSAMDAVQRLNVGGQRRKLMHKIESGPTENVASKRNRVWLYHRYEESFEGFQQWNRMARWPTPTKHLSYLHIVVHSKSANLNHFCGASLKLRKIGCRRTSMGGLVKWNSRFPNPIPSLNDSLGIFLLWENRQGRS